MNIGLVVLAVILGLLNIGQIAFYFYKKKKDAEIGQLSELKAKEIIENAKKEAEQIIRKGEIEGKELKQKIKEEVERELKGKRRELHEFEKRVLRKEDFVDKRMNNLDNKEKELISKEARLQERDRNLGIKEKEIDQLRVDQLKALERVAGLSRDAAKHELMKMIEFEAKKNLTKKIKKMEEDAEFTAVTKAKRIISMAIQKSASDYVSETTVSVVDLPNDDMKGRIIGREGRNIRALEKATGVDLIIDDTPEAVIVSSFDPIRREVARLSLEKLIQDGRIHPGRIEEVVEKVKIELDAQIKEEGEATVYDVGIGEIHPKLIKLIGRLKFRTSYGQNILQHSKEVAHIASFLAHEIGANVKVAKRGALLHDIGKAIDKEIEGTHIEIGVDLLRRFGEKEEIIHCVEAHHGDVECKTVEAVLVQAADALSAARPGARREILETYIKRLEKLEELASSFQGVNKTFAIQAGREIRVIVKSDEVTDDETFWLSRDISKKIEEELEYPGQIKVTVIREIRATEYAK